jgi:putrescine aminotransferase
MRAVRDTMVFSPPFIITESEMDLFAARAARAIDQTYAKVKDEVAV